MPYIKEGLRIRLNSEVTNLVSIIKETYDEDAYEGVCNYVISRLVSEVMRPENGWRYKWLNRAYGTFLSAAAEFYRRVVGPYEDQCIKENGDIY